MKKTNPLLLLLFLIPVLSLAQRGDEPNESYISISTAFNYYPQVPPYEFLSSFNDQTNDELILDFITASSGTFTIEEGETIFVERRNTNEFPSNIIGLGFGVRIQKESKLIHEISLTKFSIIKSSYVVEYVFSNRDGEVGRNFRGYEQKSGAFAFRYEIGKLFGKEKSKVKFGLTGGIEPTYYTFDWISISQHDYPIKADLFTIDFSLIPALTASIGKKMFLDFKVISNLAVADFSSAPTERFVWVSPDMHNGSLVDGSPKITWAFTVQMRYNIKEPKKKGRRR